jgi:hypothetical protein
MFAIAIGTLLIFDSLGALWPSQITTSTTTAIPLEQRSGKKTLYFFDQFLMGNRNTFCVRSFAESIFKVYDSIQIDGDNPCPMLWDIYASMFEKVGVDVEYGPVSKDTSILEYLLVMSRGKLSHGARLGCVTTTTTTMNLFLQHAQKRQDATTKENARQNAISTTTVFDDLEDPIAVEDLMINLDLGNVTATFDQNQTSASLSTSAFTNNEERHTASKDRDQLEICSLPDDWDRWTEGSSNSSGR